MTTETNVERLERIKNLPTHTPFGITNISIYKDDLDWLIQQARRAQELERKLNLSQGEKGIKAALNDHAVRIIEEKESENARLREALELADRVISDAIFDLAHGEKVDGLEYARQQIDQALKGGSE